MRRRFLWGLLLIIASVVAVGLLSNGLDPDRPSPTASPPGSPAPTRSNPFGAFLPAREMPIQLRVDIARTLGVSYFRSLTVLTAGPVAACLECGDIQQAGLRRALTIANRIFPMAPADPPTDLVQYRATVDGVLDQYMPSVLVVENEEQATKYWSGTAGQYAAELRVACQAAHARGVPCTNGGIPSGGLVATVYQHFLDQGETARAAAFAQRAFAPYQKPLLTTDSGRQEIRDTARRFDSYIDLYPGAGIDYVNFHWYVTDPETMPDVVQFLRNRTGLPVASNEIGLHSEDPELLRSTLSVADRLGLRFLIWYSFDDELGVSLVNPDGSLRSNGEAFRDYIVEHFPE